MAFANLPYQHERLQERMALFTECDPNGNGFLSFAEIDAVFRQKFGTGEAEKMMMLHAFDAAKNYGGNPNPGLGRSYVEHNEFRVFLEFVANGNAPAPAVTYGAPAAVTYGAPPAVAYGAPSAVTYGAPPVMMHASPALPSHHHQAMYPAPPHIAQMYGTIVHPGGSPAQMSARAPVPIMAAPMAYPGVAPMGPRKTRKSARPRPKQTLGRCTKACHQFIQEKPITKSRDIGGPAGTTHMIIAAIDYKCCAAPWGPPYPGGPGGLDTKFAFDDMHQLAQACGTQFVTSLFNQQVTKENVQQTIQQVGMNTQPGDTIIFFYSGHGDHLPDQDGDEAEGQDEAMCTLGADGQAEPRQFVWTRDDDLANFFTQTVKPGVNIIIVADCCHSGSIMDLDKPQWGPYNVISISGCTDTQTSAGTGQGGEMTRALLAAVEAFQQRGLQSYGVDKLHNMILHQYTAHHTSSHEQKITLNSVGDMIEWPLIPKVPFHSPTGVAPGEPGMAQAQPHAQPMMMQPQVMQHMMQPQMMMQPQVMMQPQTMMQPMMQPQIIMHQAPPVAYQQPAAYQPQTVAYQPQAMYQQAPQAMYGYA